jgi:integrase/recombinase XerD
MKQDGVRAGKWLLKEQANKLLNAPDPSTLKGKRDRHPGAFDPGGLRRGERVGLEVDPIQVRQRPFLSSPSRPQPRQT